MEREIKLEIEELEERIAPATLQVNPPTIEGRGILVPDAAMPGLQHAVGPSPVLGLELS
jgi:hypothetical protein